MEKSFEIRESLSLLCCFNSLPLEVSPLRKDYSSHPYFISIHTDTDWYHKHKHRHRKYNIDTDQDTDTHV